LPSYLRRKILSEEECEKTWVHTLDKEVRYVGNQKFDVSTESGEKQYNIALNRRRELSKRMGHGDGSKDYEKIRYENDIRNLKRITRSQKVFKMNSNNKKAS
jgi:hypothetical protein